MAKPTETENREPGAVGPRQPCPCGSGKRYKACHGKKGGAADVFVRRPFEGLPGECDLIAMRELVPAATAPITVRAPGADDDTVAKRAGSASDRRQSEATDAGVSDRRQVTLCTLLPMAAPALVRESGEVLLGLQVQHQFGDPSRDLAAVMLEALTAETGVVGMTATPGDGPRLQDLVTSDALEVTVHDGFEFWLSDADDGGPLAAALEQANEAASPTSRLTEVEAAYWTHVGSKEHLRWVMPEPEDDLLDALARLHVAGRDVIVPDARLIGMFRAHGLLTPVWDLPVGTGAEALEEPASTFRAAVDEALADTAPMTSEERSARSGLATRQVTIR